MSLHAGSSQGGSGSGGSGDVVGPSSSTDNAITRFDGATGKLVQNSLVTISDVGSIATPATNGTLTLGASSGAAMSGANGWDFGLSAAGLNITSAYYLGWSPTTSVGTPDLTLFRDAANIIRIAGAGNGVGVIKSGRLVSANTTTVALVGTASGILYTNEGSSGAISIGLPACSANLTYSFVVQTAVAIGIIAAAGDTINVGTSLSAAAGSATATTVGSSITLVGINSTAWMATSLTGTWLVS